MAKVQHFNYDVAQLLEEIREKSTSDLIDRDIQIYKDCVSPKFKESDLIVKHKMTAANLNLRKKIIEGALNKKIGDLFELFMVPHLEEHYDKVVHDGRSGEPDIVGYIEDRIEIYSIKCLDFARGGFSRPYSKSHAEIEYARKLVKKGEKKVSCGCYTLNRHNNLVHEHLFDKKLLKHNAPYTSQNMPLPLKGGRVPDPWIRGTFTKWV